MSENFEILAKFLERYGAKVEAAEAAEPPEETRFMLRQFGAGRLPVKQQIELLELLSEHPQWITYLADEVKALRPSEKKNSNAFEWPPHKHASKTASTH